MSEKPYNKISESILKEILLLVGKENILIDKESLVNYGHDETENLSYPPEVLVKPKDTFLLYLRNRPKLYSLTLSSN